MAIGQDVVEQIIGLQKAQRGDREIASLLGIHHKTVASYRRQHGLPPNGIARRFLLLVDEDHARCTRCGEIRPLTNWPMAQEGSGPRYRLSYCLECRRKQAYAAINRSERVNIKARWARLRTRASKIGVLCAISFEQFWEQWTAQGGLCFFTDAKLIIEFGVGQNPQSCSVDKIDPTRGYEDGNVVFTTNRVNSIKRDITLDEMREWMPAWHARVVKMWRKRGIICAQVADGDF